MPAHHKFKVKEVIEKERQKFLIRLPLGMYDEIKTKAAKNHRSMNSEILVALESHFRK